MCLLAFTAADPARWDLFFFVACIQAGIVLWFWKKQPLSVGLVIGAAILFRVAMAWIPPGLSDDAYRYVWDGMIQVDAGVNPFSYVPQDAALAAYHDELIYEALNSSAYYSVYPPVSQYIFFVGGLAYPYGWEASYYVIKALLIALEIAAMMMAAQLVSARMLALYAWNPYVLVEVAGQAHTEAALVFFLVLTVWCVRRHAPRAASVALACAGWVKLYPFLLFPFLWRRYGWRSLWPGMVAAVVLVAPYLSSEMPIHVAESLRLYVSYYEFNAGPYYAIKGMVHLLTGFDLSKVIGPLMGLGFLVTLPYIYRLDARYRWSIVRAFVTVVGAYVVFATTVHPWYLLGIVALIPLLDRPAWHWYWLALWSLGTYQLYVDGPYWGAVVAGWTGWFVLLSLAHRDDVLQQLLRWRARHKVDSLRPHLEDVGPNGRLLDLGAAEGYVGEALRRELGCEVVLADVADMNRTPLEHACYDGRTLPFEDDAFQVVVLYFVLHHCEDSQQVLREALRVSSRRVLVVESVYETSLQRSILVQLDRWANRLRSWGKTTVLEEHLNLRRAEDWRACIGSAGGRIGETASWGGWWHRQQLYVVELTRE